MQAIAWAAVAALALESTGPAVPLQPADKWQVAYEDALCGMARRYGEGSRAVTLAIRPVPLNDRAEIAVLIPGGRSVPRRGAAQVAFVPGRTLPATYEALAAGQRTRVVHVYLDRALLAELPSARTIAITADGGVYRFALSNAAAALRALDQCETALLKDWGVDPALRDQPRAAMTGSTAQYFSARRYPAEAMRLSQEGRTVALLAVDAAGGVTDCRVVKPSGAPSLDAETCRIARGRVRFTPARAADGGVVASHYLLPVSWTLPG